MAKPRLISGIQPTGKLHLGNYLGALKHFVDLQNSGKYECFFFIADLHALTENPDPKDLQKNIADLAVSFLAAGLDPKKSTLFTQSQVPAHTELAWMLNTITPMSELERMTQYKDKARIDYSGIQKLGRKMSAVGKEMGKKAIPSQDGRSYQVPKDLLVDLAVGFGKETSELLDLDDKRLKTNVGLLDYPVLMAADILLYDAAVVPVGEDQLQHLELTRTLARKFNGKLGKTFVEPKPLLTEVLRLMSLDNPEKKMSKSQPGGCLFLDDSPKAVREKLARATTDSGKETKYDPKKKPGVSNLILIYATLTGMTTAAVESLYAGKGYAEFKRELAEVVVETLEPFQKRKKELMKNTGLIYKTVAEGSKKAGTISTKKLLEVKKKIGLTL